MTLKIIGAGFGRMGTRATKDALEMLGFGPCHHMAEVFADNTTAKGWHDMALRPSSSPADWEALLGKFASCVDWPGCHFWRELSDAFPDAKVLLSTREPEKWWASIDKTIFEIMRSDGLPGDATKEQQEHQMMIRELINQTFPDINDKASVLKVLADHEAAVRNAIAPERLLVWSVTEGWDPLCAFLGVPVPEAPFPNRNTTKEFRENLKIDN